MIETLKRTTDHSEQPNYEAGLPANFESITHPVHPSWGHWRKLDGVEAIMANTAHLPALNDADRAARIKFVWSLTDKLSKVRESHEAKSRELTGLELGTAEYSQYSSLVGNEDSGLRAIKFLGAAVSRRFRQDDSVDNTQKIGFELGGTLQLGKMKSTKRLDALARNITLSATNNEDLELILSGEKNTDNEPRYRLERTSESLHVIVRRRRPIANIHHLLHEKGSGSQIVETAFFKESSVLIPLLLIDSESRRIIVEDCNTYPEANRLKANGINNTDAALRGGEIFQQAISGARCGDFSQPVIPLGAQYIASFRGLYPKIA